MLLYSMTILLVGCQFFKTFYVDTILAFFSQDFNKFIKDFFLIFLHCAVPVEIIMWLFSWTN